MHLNQFRVDLTGQRFGFLVALERIVIQSPNGRRRTKWKCKCDCGNYVDVYQEHLLSGATKSCGCHMGEMVSLKKTNNGQYYYIDGSDVGFGVINGSPAFIFDLDDAEIIQKNNWIVDASGYVMSMKHQRLHRVIVGAHEKLISGYVIDHINGNKLDNRKCNLRQISHGNNLKNAKVYNKNLFGVNGVRQTQGGRYRASIVCDNVVHKLGIFDTVEEAIDARLKAEKELFNEFGSEYRNSVKPIVIPNAIPDDAIVVTYNCVNNS